MKVTKLLAIYLSKLMCGFIISQLYWADRSVSIEMGRVKMGYVGVKGKGKAVPLQALTDPEGSRKLRFPDYVTMA